LWRNNGSSVYNPSAGVNLKDGGTITSVNWNSAEWWENTVKFSPSVWEFREGLPILRNMPEGIQNPVVQ